MQTVVLVDCDGVCADLHEEWLFRYNLQWDDCLTKEDITEWSIHKFVKPECGVKIYDYLSDPTLYDEVEEIDGAKEGVDKLRSLGYRVVFASAGVFPAKKDWLYKHGFLTTDKDLVIANDKGLILGSYLVDDSYGNIVTFKNGVGILFDAPHNQKEFYDVRAVGWKDVIETIQFLEQLKNFCGWADER